MWVDKMINGIYDITIVGGGPVGMFAGFYAGLRNAKVQILESLPEPGGQVQALYPEKKILDVAGFAGVAGAQLINNLKAQLATVPAVEFQANTKVINITRADDNFVITTNQGTSRSKAILLAAGNGSFKPRELRATNAEKYTNQYLFYSLPDLQQVAGQTVMVAGGGDSAVDMALTLQQTAREVILVHRRTEFRGLEHQVEQLQQSSIKLLTPYLIQELMETDAHQLLVQMKQVGGSEQQQATVDRLVVNYGFITNNRELAQWDVQPETEHGKVKVTQELETSEKGIYAVGDQALYPGKDTLIATGFGEVPLAVNAIMNRLYPDRCLPIHSTALPKKGN
ncbi:Thioredoxin reductase [Fructilactobacillus florum 2F]|nr:Thioredoxin reductase [Fructilactobacillus florum 2F]